MVIISLFSIKIPTFFSSIPWDDFLMPLPRGRVFDSLLEGSLVLGQAEKKYKNYLSCEYYAMLRCYAMLHCVMLC